MSYMYEFELPGLPSMTNPKSGASRSNFWARAKEAKEWKENVWRAVGSRKPRAPLKYAHLVLTRYSSVSPDADGLVSGFKHVIDGLVACGVLENDRWENIAMPEYRWVKVKAGQGKIRVQVFERAVQPTVEGTV